MNIRKLFLLLFLPCVFYTGAARSYDLLDKDMAIQNGVNIFDISNVFTEIYKKLNDVSWSGKSINVAIESLENIHKDAHIAATDKRVILVWKDAIVANYPRPDADDFDGFGQVTTALVLKLRLLNPEFGKLSIEQMYKSVLDALMYGIDENGKYIFAKKEAEPDFKILTSTGIEGDQDKYGNFRVHGIYKGSPADVAGIDEGDLISKINGQDTASMTDSEIGAVFSGFNSGTLKLVLIKPSGTEKVVLRRAAIVMADADIIYKKIKSENAGQNSAILEIVIHKITESAVSIVNEAIARHDDITGVVLDLRASAGDDSSAAAKLAGLFIGQNPVMRIVETAKSESEIIPGGSAVIDAPTVVLISNATTGAAEVLASAFYETRKGLLVGTPTAGDTRLSTVIDLENGGQLVLMNKSIKTGLGRDIEGRGIFPMVCLSNIRSDQQQGAFFINVLNGDFRVQDFNLKTDVPASDIKKGCPVITSGVDEDLLSTGVSVKILTDQKIYEKLLGE